MESLKIVKRTARGLFEMMRGRRVQRRTVSDAEDLRNSMVSRQALVILAVVAVLLLGSALPSFAITAPTSGSLFYDIYDIVVNSMLKGAIGFVAAILVFMMGIGLFFVQKIIPGIIGVLCAALIIKADTIVTSLGLIF